MHQEKDATIRLSKLPLKNKGCCLNKQDFWDLVKLKYGWSLSRQPTESFQNNVQHPLPCKKGSFITLRHNIVEM